MNNTTFITAQEIASETGISKSGAYRLIQRLNDELDKKGYITFKGRVNRFYFNQRVFKEETMNNASVQR